MDWSSFTKGYFLNRDTLVGVLLLVDASVPPQKIDLDCANWLGRNNVRLLSLQLKKFSYMQIADLNIKRFTFRIIDATSVLISSNYLSIRLFWCHRSH